MPLVVRPRFSIIIACHNEARTIDQKLANTLALRCAAPVEVIVVDDHSTDATLEHVEVCLRERAPLSPGQAVAVLTNRHAAGKNGALMTAFEHASGEVHLITDADIELGPSTLDAAWERFEGDPQLGGLCLTPSLRSTDATTLERYAAHYEPFNRRVKMLQSRLDSVPMLHGQAMFIRAAAAVVPGENLPADDVDFAIQIRLAGYRVRYAADLPFVETVSPDPRQLERQKIRRAKAVMRSLWHHRRVLLNPRFGLFGLICYPIDFAMYFGAIPVVIAAGVAAAWVLTIEPVAGGMVVVCVAASTLLPAVRQLLVYAGLLLRAHVELWHEQVPRLRWLPQRP